MGRVFSEDDYQRRLDELDASNVSVGQEVGLIWEGAMDYGAGSGAARVLNAKKDIMRAKQEALRQARKAMINAIRAAEREQSFNSILPTEVEEIATGSPGEQLIKVP